MEYEHHSNAAGWIAFFLGVMVFALGLVVVCLILQPKGRVSCADFGSYEDMVAAYRSYAPWLDGNDHDGKPCENFLPKSI